jgi:chitosanase
MLTPLQKETAEAIVNIFETGRLKGDYGCVTCLKGDTGHLTYGCRQTTLGSGNLGLLLHAYCEAEGLYSEKLRPFLPALDARDISLDDNDEVKSLLRLAGDDTVMRKVQDEFFDRIYWFPAVQSAAGLGVTKALSIAIIHDSKIHGSFSTVKELTEQEHGRVSIIGEESWMDSYVQVRKNWLAGHTNPLLHKTVYRMEELKKLIDGDKWDLPLPLIVRNVLISDVSLGAASEPPVVASAADANDRVLFLTEPMMRGQDVKRLQKMLGFSDQDADGIFGKGTDQAVREFQRTHGLRVDGKVGPATWAELE